MLKTREQIIEDMCFTARHDFGIDREFDNGFVSSISAGMTQAERDALRRDMSQLYDHHIHPIVHELTELKNGNSVILPVNVDHAQSMLQVAHFYLYQHNK